MSNKITSFEGWIKERRKGNEGRNLMRPWSDTRSPPRLVTGYQPCPLSASKAYVNSQDTFLLPWDSLIYPFYGIVQQEPILPLGSHEGLFCEEVFIESGVKLENPDICDGGMAGD